MEAADIIAAIREEAAECLASSIGNGEYNAPFYAIHIVLEHLAKRLECKLSQPQDPSQGGGKP